MLAIHDIDFSGPIMNGMCLHSYKIPGCMILCISLAENNINLDPFMCIVSLANFQPFNMHSILGLEFIKLGLMVW